MTHHYYGTKRITAIPAGKTDDHGVIRDGYEVTYEDGYVSWSPRDVFEAAYQPIDAMDFGHAIKAMRHGHRVARRGWNGKGMFIWIEKGSIDGEYYGFPTGQNPIENHPSSMNGVSFGLFECGDSGTTVRMPRVDMRAADGSVVTGWLASQTDMLASDWQIVVD
jgi:hypothetical protein